MLTRDVAIVRRYKTVDVFGYEIVDDKLRRHIVEIRAEVLHKEPTEFTRGTDQQHLDIVACGTVMCNLSPDTIYHRVDPEMVDRAYTAALKVESFERLTVLDRDVK